MKEKIVKKGLTKLLLGVAFTLAMVFSLCQLTCYANSTVTVHYNNGIYDGFAPYWKADGTQADATLTSGDPFTLPGSSAYTNVGYTLDGWTLVQPSSGSTPTVQYAAGDTLDASTVTNLCDNATGDITFYAVWNRDTSKYVWNETLNKLYTSDTSSSNAFKTAYDDAKTRSDVIFILQDHNFYSPNGMFFQNVTVDGGVYHYDASTGQRVFGGQDTAKATYGDHTRYTLYENETGGPGHALEIKANFSGTFKNVVFTKGANYWSKSNGLFWLHSNSTLTFDNVEIYELGRNPNQDGTALIGCGDGTAKLFLKNCYFHDNTSEGGIFVAGNTMTRNVAEAGGGDIIVTLQGDTKIINNKTGSTLMNVKIVPPRFTSNGVHLHIDDSFNGKVGVYLPKSHGLIGALCTNRDQAIALINSGNITSDQGYKLIPTPASYNPSVSGYTSAIRVAEDATLTFNANGGSGTFPTKATVDGTETDITNGVLDAYIGAEVDLPGAGTISKSGYAFSGWNTQADGSGTDYAAGNKLTLDTNTTIYAKWVAHIHNWHYTSTENTIEAYCSTSGCPSGTNSTNKVALTIIDAAAPDYFDFENLENFNNATGGIVQKSDVKFFKVTTEGATTGGSEVTTPTEAGFYYASLTVGGVTAVKAFTIGSSSPQPDPKPSEPQNSNGDSQNSNGESHDGASTPYVEATMPAANGIINITPNIATNAMKGILFDNNLKEAFGVTEAEQQSGLWVWMEIKDITKVVPQKDAVIVTTNKGNAALGAYLDITLFKQVPGQEKTQIRQTNVPVNISIEVPAALVSPNRVYAIARVHDGQYEQITEFVKPDAFNRLTFSSNLFSTYALLYKDGGKAANPAKTGDTPIVWGIVLVAAFAGMIALVVSKKKEEA